MSAAKTKFRLALEAAGFDVSPFADDGLRAIKNEHRPQIVPASSRRLTGSVDLDNAAKPLHPDAHRWDYGIGLKPPSGGEEVAVWVEVHPANTSEVATMLAKLDWLRQQLRTHKALNTLTENARVNGIDPFCWLPTKAGVHIPPHTPQAKRLAASGLQMPRSPLRLP